MGFTTCWKCKSQFWMPPDLDAAARRDSKIRVFCAHGHSGSFPEGETEEAKLRRDRDRLAQRVAEKDDEIKHQRELREGTERQLSATRGVVTRIKNRVGAGVCPCCTRSFSNLRRHMETRHTDYRAEAAE